MPKDILSFFDGTPREVQVEALRAVQRIWHDSDVIVIEAAVASGKSLMADCIARWASSKRGLDAGATGIVANNRLLVEQYMAALKGACSLKRKDDYTCARTGMTCGQRVTKFGSGCKSASGNIHAADGCPYVSALRKARSAQKLVVNQHTLLAHKLYQPTMIIDECHTVTNFLEAAAGTTLWRPAYQWPASMRDMGDVRRWVDTLSDSVIQADRHLLALARVIYGDEEGVALGLGEDTYFGKDAEFIRLAPLQTGHMGHLLWPASVRKLVLMSATVSAVDIRSWGLEGRRVAYVRAPSPIPVDRRPLLYHPIASMVHNNREAGVHDIARFLAEDLLPQHRGERGLIHAPYGVAAELRGLLGGDPRFVWHGRTDRNRVIGEWTAGRLGPADSVLVASGAYEGLDLLGDKARFQVFAASTRKSLADPGISWLAEHEPDRYEWLSVRDLAQGYGRVCRDPSDYGLTIVAASELSRELESDLAPSWLKEAVIK